MKNNEIFNVELITSKTNSTIVKIAKLTDKKYRKSENLFVCNGKKLFIEAINFGAKIKYIVLNNEALFEENIVGKIVEASMKNVQILCVSDAVFSKLTEEKSPEGIIVVCEYLDTKHIFSAIVKNIKSNEKIMILESIRDPGNLGTIIRNAAAFGIEKLILSSDCVDIYSSKVIRAAMGAIFKVNIEVVSNLAESILSLKKAGYCVYGAALEKSSLVLGDQCLTNTDIIVIGNEGHGLSKETKDACDNTFLIPMQDNTESLNAAMAATIFMWEQYK